MGATLKSGWVFGRYGRVNVAYARYVGTYVCGKFPIVSMFFFVHVQVRCESTAEDLSATRKHLDESQQTREILTGKLKEMTAKLDATNGQLSELSKEHQGLLSSMESLRNEKHSVDKTKVELHLMLETLNADFEKSQSAKSHLQKMYDILSEEKQMLELDLQCARKDKEITEMNLR